jgi:hypothetical protein
MASDVRLIFKIEKLDFFFTQFTNHTAASQGLEMASLGAICGLELAKLPSTHPTTGHRAHRDDVLAPCG